jgi:hypothetical protein
VPAVERQVPTVGRKLQQTVEQQLTILAVQRSAQMPTVGRQVPTVGRQIQTVGQEQQTVGQQLTILAVQRSDKSHRQSVGRELQQTVEQQLTILAVQRAAQMPTVGQEPPTVGRSKSNFT